MHHVLHNVYLQSCTCMCICVNVHVSLYYMRHELWTILDWIANRISTNYVMVSTAWPFSHLHVHVCNYYYYYMCICTHVYMCIDCNTEWWPWGVAAIWIKEFVSARCSCVKAGFQCSNCYPGSLGLCRNQEKTTSKEVVPLSPSIHTDSGSAPFWPWNMFLYTSYFICCFWSQCCLQWFVISVKVSLVPFFRVVTVF